MSRHHALTQLILNLNSMLNSGRFDHISVEEAEHHVEEGDLLEWLKGVAPEDFRYELFTQVYKGSKEFFNWQFQALTDTADLGRKFGAKNRGLCALIALANEVLQQGEGWNERKDVARR